MQRLRELILRELYGGLWHTTHFDRFARILKCGAILPEPDILESERWGMSYVRSLGGVSLFDFEGFEPDAYSDKYPLSSWADFIPPPTLWNSAIWIEIDRECISTHLISGPNLLIQWKSEKSCKRLMPHIEALHLGPLPKTAFKRAFFICKGDNEIHSIVCK